MSMILFLEDWQKNPSVIMDYETSNKSALTLALKLKAVGIKNHAFFLALHNPALQGVDPYSPSLTPEQMVAIGMECRVNPWYFFREIARAPAIAGTEPSRIEFNRANVSLWWSFFNHITFILIQPRQTGKSFCTDLLMTELFGFFCTATQINLLTKDDKLRGENVKRLKAIYEELPPYLNLKTRDDINNMEEISIKRLRNYYITHVPQASEKRANNMGRGLTTPILHFDEPPFQQNIKVAYEAAVGAMGAAIDAAKRNGEPYGILMTTTAGKKDDKDGKYIYEYAMQAARWTDLYYDAINQVELERIVRTNSRAGDGGVYRIYGCFSYKQLGKTDQWMRDQLDRSRSAAGSASDNANRDYFNVWTSGSQSAPLPGWILERLAASIVDPDADLISPIGSYVTRWYVPESEIAQFMRERKTIAGIDTSDAVGADGISFVLTDVETGGTVAVANVSETNLIIFAQWLVDMIVRYENMTIIPERRSSAVTIIDYLLMFLPQRGINPFKRIFNWVVNDPLEHKDRYEEARQPMTRWSSDLLTRCKKYFGFATSGSGETSRSELYGTTLQNAAKRCCEQVHDRDLTEQITGLVTRNGRVDHDIGGHDDLVIGWLLCHWFLTMAKNLAHYGIDSRRVMVTHQKQVVYTPQEAYQEHEQQQVRQRIEQLFSLMKEETDENITEGYERELRYLDGRLILKDGEYFSIDAMVNQAREERQKSRLYASATSARSIYEQMGYAHAPQVVNGLSGGAFAAFH